MEARDYVSDLLHRGWTQFQIAQRTGIPQPTISKVVRGATKDVLSQNYRKLQALHAEVLTAKLPDAAACGRIDTPPEVSRA
jgi:transcriptional regulator with XRE-family HTH domain